MNKHYNYIIKAAVLVSKPVAFFVPKVNEWHVGIKSAWLLLSSIQKSEHQKLWFHCASLGEFEQARPVMELFRQRYPHYKILVTFFSPSGYRVRHNWPGVDWVCYLPADTAANAHDFVQAVKPSLAFFVKYEFWENYTAELYRRRIPMFSLSASMHPGSSYFKWGLTGFYKKIFGRFTAFFAQNTDTVSLLNHAGIRNVIHTGDTRFDRVLEQSLQPAAYAAVDAFAAGAGVLVAGSVWGKDISALTGFVEKYTGRPLGNFSKIKVIIAPHLISSVLINYLSQMWDVKTVKYSEITAGTAANYDLLLIDNIGMLASLYAKADVAWVGGAFKEGLHNILEPAGFGKPIITGPRHQGYPEAAELTKLGGVFPVNTEADASKILIKLFESESFRTNAGDACSRYVQSRAGAAERVMEYLVKNGYCK